MAEINATQINVGDAKSQVQNTTDAAKNQAKGAVDSAKAQAQAKANEAKDKAKAAADAAKSKAKEALDAAKAQAMGKLGPILGAVAGIKEGLKKLKKPIPKTPAVKKFEPKKAPTPQKFESKGNEIDYNKKEQTPPQPEAILITTYKGYEIFKKQKGPFVQFFTKKDGKVVHTGPESRSETDQTLINYEKAAIDQTGQSNQTKKSFYTYTFTGGRNPVILVEDPGGNPIDRIKFTSPVTEEYAKQRIIENNRGLSGIEQMTKKM